MKHVYSAVVIGNSITAEDDVIHVQRTQCLARNERTFVKALIETGMLEY